jgi:integrase
MQQARQTKDAGTDPAAQRKQAKLQKTLNPSNTLASVTREWYERQKPQWSDEHAVRIIRRFERDLFPLLGEKELASIKAPELLAVLRKIEQRGAIETADRALMDCGQVWRYGVATGRVERDMCADLKGALTPYRGKHLGAIIKPNDFAQLLHQLKAYKGTLIVKAALELAPLVFVRPNELRLAEWSEFDLTAALWTIPSQRMKQRKRRTAYCAPVYASGENLASLAPFHWKQSLCV